MKFLIGSILFAALGLGTWRLADGASPAPCSQETCDAKVTCTDEGTCRIECTGPDGSTCWVELACDGDTCKVVASDCGGDGCCTSGCAKPCAPKAAK